MNKVKMGIIGPGGIAHKFANACSYVEQVELVAVASTNLEKAKTFADEFGIEKAYGSYQELLADKSVEAVYISVINCAHFSAIELAAKSGKAILCEKPSVIDMEQWNQVEQLLKENDVLFMEGMWTLHLPTIQKGKEWIDAGKIGVVKSIESTFSFYADKNNSPRLFQKDLGGGSLLDVGVYCIAFSNYMADAYPETVKAIEMVNESDVDEYGTVIFGYKNNVIAENRYGITLRRPHHGYVYGEDGGIEFVNFWDCKLVNRYDREGNLVETFEEQYENGFMYEIKHFCELVIGNKKESEVNTIANSRDYIKLYEAIRDQRS